MVRSSIVIVIALIVGFAGGLSGAFVYSHFLSASNSNSSDSNLTHISTVYKSPYLTPMMLSNVFGGNWDLVSNKPYNSNSENLPIINGSIALFISGNSSVNETVLNFTTSEYANESFVSISFLLSILSGFNYKMSYSFSHSFIDNIPILYVINSSASAIMFPFENHIVEIGLKNLTLSSQSLYELAYNLINN